LDLLPTLTDADLRELGVVSLGHRKRLLTAFNALAVPAELQPSSPLLPATGPEAGRRQLTVMFVDLVSSTELARRLDPEDLRDVIGSYHRCCAEHITRYDGYIAKYMGDGVLAYFGWPCAHEHEVESAIRAGLAVVEAVADLRATDIMPLTGRVGIATGPVVVGDLIGTEDARERAVVGAAPNLAARLQSLANPGSVVIAEGTRALLGDLFTLLDLGAVQIKGFDEPVHAWQVAGEGVAEGRFEAMHVAGLTPLMGRDHESALLLDRWERAKEGEGQVVLLAGEPGIGKSRLIRALREHLADEPYTVLSHFCSPHHANTALHPVIGLLKRAAGLQREDPPEQQLDKLEAMLAHAVEDVREAVPVLADLLAIPAADRYPLLELSPQQKKEKTFQTFFDQLSGLAARRPTLAIYEDVHWADPTTIELLGRIFDRVQHLPVLTIVTFRPEFVPPWTVHGHITTLSLSRLGRRQGIAIIERLTGGKGLPGEVLEQILARTDGVPLFVEELTKAVLESGLVADAGDHFELSGPLPPLAIPATLHDSLMARLDRLAAAKQVAQIGAVIGREFGHELIVAVAGLPEDALTAALDQLVQAELIFRRGMPPDATYIFKHALVRDAACQSLLKSRHLQLHAQIAAALEQHFPDMTATEPELLAHHYTSAGLIKAGVHYWERAGARATERSAYVEAISQYGKGLEFLRSLPEGRERDLLELSLQMGLGDALSWTRGFAAFEVEAAYNRAHELSRQIGETSDLFRILWGLWHFFVIRADFGRAQTLSDELSQLGEHLQDPSLAPHIFRTRGETCLWRGEFVAALRETSECLTNPDLPPPKLLPGVQDPLVMCGLWEALALWHLGYPDRALRSADAALERARNSTQSGDFGAALLFAAWVRLLRRETRSAREFAEAALRFNAAHDLAFHVAISKCLLGSALVVEENDESGLTRIRDGIAGSSATGAGVFQPWFLGVLAASHSHLGNDTAGLAALAEAEALINRSGERWSEAEMHRLKGELQLSVKGAEAEAEQCLYTAIAVARGQQARSSELRAANSIARLWCAQSKRAEVRDLLAPIYGWFTEGFDTPDMRDAEELLDRAR
jgi:class 3 adenylate cyclase/tetratricopeptide (TPR) repeat protein